MERVAAREQRETARPIIDGTLLGEQAWSFPGISSIFHRCSKRRPRQSPQPSKDK